MEELRKITKSKDVTLDTKAEITHILIFPVSLYSCKSWTVKKSGRKNIESSVDTLDCQKVEQVGPRANQTLNIAEGKNNNTEAVYSGHIKRR